MRRDTSPFFYDSFTRQQWARFDAGSYRLAPAALTLLKGVNEPMLISEGQMAFLERSQAGTSAL